MKLCSAALLMIALTQSMPVSAAAPTPSASASVTNFRVSLIDLDVNDGIAASLEYVPPQDGFEDGWAFAEAQHGPQRTNSTFGHREYQTAPWQTVTTGAQLNDGAASLAVSSAVGGTSLSTLALSVTANADNPDGSTWAYGRALAPLLFRLSPNTTLSVSFDLNVSAAHPGAEAPGAAEAYAEVAFFTPDGSTPWFFKSYEAAHALGADRFGGVGEPGTTTLTAELTSGAQTLDINLVAQASASALTASPVPEPGTWGMLLAGLMLIGARSMRARR